MTAEKLSTGPRSRKYARPKRTRTLLIKLALEQAILAEQSHLSELPNTQYYAYDRMWSRDLIEDWENELKRRTK